MTPNGTRELRLFDNTKVSAFKRCPRYYLYRHVKDWAPEGKSTALIFGSSWHAAMDVIWTYLKTTKREELAQMAFSALLAVWMKEGMPAPADIDYELEKELSPRTPMQALEMIVAYIDARQRTAGDFDIVAIESPFAVPLDPNDDTLFYIGKIDKIVKRRGKVLGIEHKTTTAYKKNGPFRAAFTDSFSPNSQVDGYLYALHMMFPNEVGGIWVDAALVHKQEEGFMFIPIERQMQHLDNWLWEVRFWISEIERHASLAIESADAPYLKAFPKNTNSCWDFGASCPYLNLCKMWPNPIGYDLPPGYVKSHWNPLEHIKGLDGLGKAEQ